ncbi:MAG: SUMF1/EgtB/PvdO family nonheme iron enzyme [Deltaproteobacteria bacterium]|nr:SUMF1/EgtB/PvdO family nonheme iron enzyme [Deltaproteobacteria bacterium]
MGRGALVLSLLLTSSSAFASGGLDIDGWLQKEGVKLLAVEFYATWCKPCMEAVPKWKALHEKYKKRGLRLVVVATQDPQAGCGSPGWTPDDLVCDLEGTVAERFGAQNLPSAFLWGWQGHQLVAKAHVEDVEAAIESWMREAPRVEVEVGELIKGIKLTKEELRRLVMDELNRKDKLVVVASEAERKKLAALRKRSFEAGFDENLQCEVGKELSANSLLEASVVGDSKRPRLTLQLRSVETGCLSASGVVDLDPDRAASSVAEAMTTLVNRTRTETQLPGGNAARPKKAAPKRIDPSSIEEKPSDWVPEASDEVLVSFSSTPAGAVVLVDGDVLCQSTPCRKELSKGPHSVAMQKERYEKRSERVTAAANAKIDWKLEAAVGVISVSSEPSALPVFVDGSKVGETPLSTHELDPGAHEVWVEDKCYLKKGERFGLAKGESRSLTFSPVARESALEVRAEDGDGNAAEGEVFVDGKRLGSAPGTWKVALCARKVEVRSTDGSFEDELRLEERKTSKVKATLGSRRGGPGGRGDLVSISAGEFWMGCGPRGSNCAGDEKPGRKVYLDAFAIDRTEVTVARYNQCVSSGSCQAASGNSKDDHPVVNVDWNQASAFCKWAGGALPTEAQWEKAARGPDGRTYPWGNEAPSCTRANAGCGGGTQPVGSRPAGAHGLFDMAGNVWEWVEDVYDAQAYSRLGARNPVSRSGGSLRVDRGGSWFGDGGGVRASYRGRGDPGDRFGDLGFRCARPSP